MAVLLCLGACTPAAAPAPDARRVLDPAGQVVTLPPGPLTRLVALSPEATELLFALGLGPRVVGVSRFSNFPPQAASLPKVGSYTDINLEQVAALSPDLVIATTSGNSPLVVERLARAGTPVYTLNPRTLTDIASGMASLASLLLPPHDPGARAPVTAFETALTQSLTRARKAVDAAGLSGGRAILFMQVQPFRLVAAGTLLDDLVTTLGLANAGTTAGAAYPVVSAEAVAAMEADLAVYIPMDAREDTRRDMAAAIVPVTPRARWRCALPTDQATRAAPRIVEAIDALSACLESPRQEQRP